ncbi:putative methyltransferase-domain-containing protein [Phycomyces blakesleeanus]
MVDSTSRDKLTDEEFRQKLEAHFALYRLNLRSPLITNITVNQWYRADLLLVNEVGLFRRADIEPDGIVEIGCEILQSRHSKMAPLEADPEWKIEIRPAHTWNKRTNTLLNQFDEIPGFQASGRGALEYRLVKAQTKTKALEGSGEGSGAKVTSNLDNAVQSQKPRHYLRFYPTKLDKFPQQNDKNPDPMDIILPLVVGPLYVEDNSNNNNLSRKDTSSSLPSSSPSVNTYAPPELWPDTTEMVYDTYRMFNTKNNVVIHESWDSGIPGKIWDSALVMLDVLKKMAAVKPEYLSSKHIVDLSAGTGLLGLYLASLMTKESDSQVKCGKITITELDEALALIDKNVDLNQYLVPDQPNDISSATTTIRLATKPLLWGNLEQAAECGKADVILASDVLYESEFFEDLVKTFVDLSTSETRIYIGYKRRGFEAADERRFWALCGEHFDVSFLTADNSQDTDSCLVPFSALATGVQLYRLTVKHTSLR